MWVDSAHWAEAVWDRVGAAMWLDRGNEAQKSLFQSISRHLKFRVTFRPSYPRHGGGFHRSRKILGHNREWFGPQEGLLYHFIPKQKFLHFKIFLECLKMP